MVIKIKNNKKIKTDSDEARQMFIEGNITYEDIKKSDYYLLLAILAKNLQIHNKRQKEMPKNDRNYFMEISDKKSIYKMAKVGMKYARIQVTCDKYSIREGITFNSNGWVGIAGWADSDNLKPIVCALKKWVHILSFRKYWIRHKK